MDEIQRLLFVCTGNTCRSVMAEYLAKARFDPRTTQIESAGIRIIPSENTADAVNTLRVNFGIDASDHIPRSIDQVNLSDFTLIVAIDDPGRNQILQTLKQRGASNELTIAWKIPDPYGDDPSAYDGCAARLKRNLVELEGSHKLDRKKHGR